MYGFSKKKDFNKLFDNNANSDKANKFYFYLQEIK